MADEALLTWIERGQLIAALLVAVGVSGEFRLQFAARPINRRIEFAREKEVAGLRKEAEDARLARVKIEQQMADRDLTPAEMAAFSARLSGFSGQRAVIDVFPVAFESSAIANQLMGGLIDAGWIVSGPTLLSAPANVRSFNPGSRPSPFLVQGIMVRATDDKHSQDAAHALFEAMAAPATSGMLFPGPLPNPEDPRVWIYVGDKPMPLRSWVK